MTDEQHWGDPARFNLNEWPVIDRQLWIDADILRSKYQLRTQRTIGSEYGRFLRFLVCYGHLDPTALPSARFDELQRQRYVTELQALGLRKRTIQC